MAVALTLNAGAARAEGDRGAGPIVLMLEYTYDPKTISVEAGTTLTWHNAGKLAHTATFPGVFDTGSVPPGGDKSITLTKPGTYRYFCRFHGGPNGAGMNGIVIVTAPAAQPGPVAQPPLPRAGADSDLPRLAPLALGLIVLGLAARLALDRRASANPRRPARPPTL